MTTLCIRFRNMLLAHSMADRREILANLVAWLEHAKVDHTYLMGLRTLQVMFEHSEQANANCRNSPVWNFFKEADWSSPFRAIIDAELDISKVDPSWWFERLRTTPVA